MAVVHAVFQQHTLMLYSYLASRIYHGIDLHPSYHPNFYGQAHILSCFGSVVLQYWYLIK